MEEDFLYGDIFVVYVLHKRQIVNDFKPKKMMKTR